MQLASKHQALHADRLKCFAFRLFIVTQIIFSSLSSTWAQPVLSDENPLSLPEVGSYGLRVLSPTVLELTLIAGKLADPAPVSAWDFVSADLTLNLPAINKFVVKADGVVLPVTQVGFKRRPIYAPEKPRDLRI